MRRTLTIISCILGLLCPANAHNHYEHGAETVIVDSALTISLLTCSPGNQVYELYGHTALRVKSPMTGLDKVYNYGAFDFSAPHFLWRFILGDCDYMLYPSSMEFFVDEYRRRGSEVVEQVLNLSPYEATFIADSLQRKSLPENRVYRYNIFRNNCTTMARDLIEGCIDGVLIFPEHRPRNSFRSILHQYTGEHKWAREGNDLLLGADMDTLIHERDEMFSPIYFMNYMDSAVYHAGIHRYKQIVRERRIIVPANPERLKATAEDSPLLPSPAFCGWGMLALGLLLALWEWHRHRILWPVDVVLMTLQGLAGLLLVFMALFSQHPGLSSNWQVWVLNPVPLFFAYTVAKADIRRKPCIYHALAAGFLSLFIVLYAFLPQHFSQLILPLALLLLSRAMIHLAVFKQR